MGFVFAIFWGAIIGLAIADCTNPLVLARDVIDGVFGDKKKS